MLSLSMSACHAVQAQPERLLPVSAEPISRQQSAAMNTFPTPVEIRRDPRLGTITFLKAANLSEGLEHNADFARLQADNQFGDIARAFIEAYRDEFRLTEPARELRVESVETDTLGLSLALQSSHRAVQPPGGCPMQSVRPITSPRSTTIIGSDTIEIRLMVRARRFVR